MNQEQITTVLKALEIAKSTLSDYDKKVYELEIKNLSNIQATILHLEYYLGKKED